MPWWAWVALALIAAGSIVPFALDWWWAFEHGARMDRLLAPFVWFAVFGLFVAWMCWDVWRDS